MPKDKIDKKIHEESYDLDYFLIVWLNEHIKCYINDASSKIDLDFEKYSFRDKQITLREALNMIIDDTDYLLNSTVYDWHGTNEQKYDDIKVISFKKDEMYDLLKLIHWHLWW